MANGLTPNIGAQVSQGLGILGQVQGIQAQQQALEAAQAQSQQQQLLQGLVGQALGAPQQAPQLAGQQPQAQPVTQQASVLTGKAQQPMTMAQREQAAAKIFAVNPDLGKQVFDQIGAVTAQQKESAATRAFELMNTPPEQRPAVIQRQATQLRQEGRDPSDTLSLLDLPAEQQDQALSIVRGAALSEKQRAESEISRDRLTATKEATEQRRIAAQQAAEDRKESARLRAQEAEIKRDEAAIKRETNELKRQELQQKVDQAKRDRQFNAESAVANVQQSMDTVDRLLAGEALEKAAGVEANFPTIAGTEAAGFEATLDTLQSQAFLGQVEKMKGLGALSENEGKKLAQAIGTLSIDVPDEQLRAELGRIKGVLAEAKAKLERKFDIAEPEVTQQQQTIGRFTVEVE